MVDPAVIVKVPTPDESAEILRDFTDSVEYETRPDADQRIPDPDPEPDEGEHVGGDEVYVEERWEAASLGRFTERIEELAVGEQVKLPDGTRVKRDADTDFRVVRDGAIRHQESAEEAARNALDRSARGTKHPAAVGGRKRYKDFAALV